MTTMESIYKITRMKALSILILTLSFGTISEVSAQNQLRPLPDTLTYTPNVKTIKGANQTVQVFNGKGYNTYKEFYDGLSRPVQKHALAASPAGKDVISFTIYDCMGRADSVTYLPYVIGSGTGALRKDPVAEQQRFYRLTMGFSVDGYYAFSRKNYAKTPYEQVEMTDAPGRYYNSHSSLSHTLTHTQRVNQPVGNAGHNLDKVSNYRITNDSVLVYIGPYPAGQLLVQQSRMKITDSDIKIALEYINPQGQSVAKGELINDSLHRLDYYVYDDFGNLRYQIPAIEDKVIAKNSTVRYYRPSELRYSFYYGYDKYGDRVTVRNPDQAPVEYIFDAKHRVILSQDGNQRQSKQWTYTEYDEYNRVLRKSMVYVDADLQTVRGWLREKYGPDANKVIVTKFAGKRLLEQFQYTGYDEPDGAGNFFQFKTPSYLAYKSELPYLAATRKSDNPGAVYYQKTAVLSSDPADTLSYIERAYYYDDKGRTIQTVIRNHLKGITRISNQYDKVGNLLATHESKQISARATADVKVVKSKYDNFGRLLSQRTSLNDSPWAVVNYSYDELGRCSEVIYGDSILNTRYTYDMVGRQIMQNNEVFSMELRYENPSLTKEAKPHYGGLITECSWLNKKIPGGMTQTYAYSYTPFGQLAGVAQYEGTIRRDKFVEQGIIYNENHNILSLSRLENANVINHYSYFYQGNKLTHLSDVTGTSTFEYDPNGNVVYDGRKSCNFRYNCLNLLERATDPKENLLAQYSYLSDGTKLAVRDKDGNGYTYMGSLIYQSNGGSLSLESAQFNGGSILKTSSEYEVVYRVTDFLGSVRAVVDSKGKVLEYNNYYPFGGRWEEDLPRFASNRYRFNGKELQQSGRLGLLDYGARMYDPALARWQGCDPAMQFTNPFVFCGNNPVAYVDKDGEFAWFLIGLGALVGSYLGGSAANNNWNPGRWDWSSGKTWGGFLGGAIQGGIEGASFAYGLSAITGTTLFTNKTISTVGYCARGTSLVFTTAKVLTTGMSMMNNFDNAMDIIRGNYLYQGDNFGGMLGRALSRSFWERPQQYAGYLFSQARNATCTVDVSYFEGATVINEANTNKHKGLTLGNMINGWDIYSKNSSMLYHEYGHVIQSRFFGPSYLFAVGIPSAIIAGKDNGYWTETMANNMSQEYFGEQVWNQTAGSQIDHNGNPKYPIFTY